MSTSPEQARDRGTIALYTVLFTPAVLMLAGLLVDGGLAIHARQRAADVAEQAARAGANQIDEAHLRATGEPRVLTGPACDEAAALVAAYNDSRINGSPGCQASTGEVTVTVQMTVQPTLLSIVPGLGNFTMESTASAHPVTGNDVEP